MTVRRAAGFVIFREVVSGRQFLLLQASNQNHHWCPPKGHVDPGEDDLTTAYRETQEEAGIKKDQLHLYEDCTSELKYEAWGHPKAVTYWLAKLNNPEDPVTISHEHMDFKWCGLDEAISLIPAFKDLQSTLTQFNSYLKDK